jgi:hypothetical protein
MWLLRDPLQLAPQQLVMPSPLAQLLMFCDGTRTPQEIHVAFSHYLDSEIDYEIVSETLAQLDAAYLLDNERSRQARESLLREYRTSAHRPLALAGLGYPADAGQLSRLFDRYGCEEGSARERRWHGRGMISPHIDYQRGGPVYAKVWRRAEQAILDADLVLIVGTDHSGSTGTLTLTRLPYATPYGVLPADVDLVDKLAQTIGTDAAFAEELHHRNEHSVELSAVWLHHMYQQANAAPCPMVPILCGSFQHYLVNGAHPAEDERLTAAIETLRRETAGKRVLTVASVDLAHVGPSFGDDFTMDADRRSHLAQVDGRLMQLILQGDADGFFSQISAVQDRYRICGFSSIYMMLRLLGPTSGTQVAYEQCPADSQNHSLVSICGLLLD